VSTIAGCAFGLKKLAEVHPRRQHRLDAVEAALNSVCAEEFAHFADGRAGRAQIEGVADHRRLGWVRLETAVLTLAEPGRDVREGRPTVGDRAPLRVLRALGGHAAMVFGDGAKHRPAEPLPGAAVRDVPDVDGEDCPACMLDPLDDFGMDGERADEPVEVGDDDNVGAAFLDHLDGAADAGAPSERSAAAHVELLKDLEQLEPVAGAG
jgi:hypothetical protein